MSWLQNVFFSISSIINNLFVSFRAVKTSNLSYGGHLRISDNDLIKQILYHFCASHIPTNKLQHVYYSELLSNNCHDATAMVARQQKIAG